MTDTDRVYFSGSYHEASPSVSPSPNTPTTLPVILRSQTTWNGLLGYFHTFSSLHTYLEQHPNDTVNNGGRSLPERTLFKLMEGAEKEMREMGQEKVNVQGEDNLIVEWPIAMVLAKKL